MDDDAVRLAVVSRLGWIRRNRMAFSQQERQSLREMLTGESHYFEGRRYLLDVTKGDSAPAVRVVGNGRMELAARRGEDRRAREIRLQQWYRKQLRERIPGFLENWEPRVGVRVAEVRIRRMKTRWGTCNPAAGRIWLNLELAKKPLACLEYILVHEMVHLLERRHNERFRALMDQVLPTWRMSRAELNRAPLAHEDWTY
jgi:predicted metal-dependent hydrolase